MYFCFLGYFAKIADQLVKVNLLIVILYSYMTVPMVLNPNGIEPTFLKLDSCFFSYYDLQCIELDKENRIQEEKN